MHGHMGPGGETHEHDYGTHGKVKISPPQPMQPDRRGSPGYGSGYSEHERVFGHPASHARGGMANAKKAKPLSTLGSQPSAVPVRKEPVQKHMTPGSPHEHAHDDPKKRHSPLDVDPSGKPRQSPYWQSPSGKQRGAEIESDWKRRGVQKHTGPGMKEHPHGKRGPDGKRVYSDKEWQAGSKPYQTPEAPKTKIEKMNSEVAKAQADLRAATSALEKHGTHDQASHGAGRRSSWKGRGGKPIPSHPGLPPHEGGWLVTTRDPQTPGYRGTRGKPRVKKAEPKQSKKSPWRVKSSGQVRVA